MFQSSLSSVSLTTSSMPEGTAEVPASMFQVVRAVLIAVSMASCEMPTLMRPLPRGPKAGVALVLLNSS